MPHGVTMSSSQIPVPGFPEKRRGGLSFLFLGLLLQSGNSKQTPQEEMWPDMTMGNKGIMAGTFL